MSIHIFQDQIDETSKIMKTTVESLNDLDSILTDKRQSIFQVSAFLKALNDEADQLRHSAQNMKETITK